MGRRSTACDDGGVRRPGPAQALRGLAAGLLTTFLALLFHIVGGGTAPSALAVALCAAATCWVAMLIGRARPSLVLLVVSTAIAQGVLHAAFSMATATATLAVEGHAGHGGHRDLVVVDSGAGHTMWLAHVLAGVLTVVGIRRGEALVRRLLELARVAVGALARLVVAALALAARPQARSAPRVVSSGRGIAAARALASVARRRGPPALAA